jgi:hypothetical protein
MYSPSLTERPQMTTSQSELTNNVQQIIKNLNSTFNYIIQHFFKIFQFKIV